MVPPITVLAAYAIVRLASVLRASSLRQSLIVGAATCLLMIPNLGNVIGYDVAHSRTDTRTLAQEWIESNVAPGARVFMRGNPEVKSALPVQLESTVENLIAMSRQRQDDNPGKAKFLRIRAALAREPAYDILTTRQTEPWPSWKACKESGVEFVIMRHRVPNESSPIPKSRIPRSRARFDRDLNGDPSVELVASFDPDQLRSPGPFIRIYSVPRTTSD